ncbi:MAG: HAD hydrolase-like protein [Lysobacterales bacterium]|jgi:phosphoglycolate phosphatase
MSREFTTVVFDLDGTLSDPAEGIFRCINHALARHGQPKVGRGRAEAQIGPPLDEAFAALAPSADSNDIARMIATYRERYASVGFRENRVYPLIPEMLAGLSKNGMRMGVCTSKREDFAVKILGHFGLRNYFAFVDGGDVGAPKRGQLSRLLDAGVIDSNAVMVGDRAVDVLAARANSLRSVGVIWGFGSQEELAGANPEFLASDPGHLRDILVHGGVAQPPVVPAPRRQTR